MPSDELDHLDKMAEAHARNGTETLRVNQQVLSLLPLVWADGDSNNTNNNNNNDEVRVLDYGCGAGRISILLAQNLQASQRKFSVVGVDITPGMIEQAKQNLLAMADQSVQQKVSFRLLTARLPTRNELLMGHPSTTTTTNDSNDLALSMDLVIMSLVLGHISPKEAGKQVVAAVASTLKPGGKFALAEFLYKADQQESSHNHSAVEEEHHHHDHSHEHHSQNHHDHHHSHNHEGTAEESHDGNDHNHHRGHMAFTEKEIREMFVSCGLEPDKEFTPFQFDWGGITMECIMAIGTKL